MRKKKEKKGIGKGTLEFSGCAGGVVTEKREEEKNEEDISKIKCPAVALKDGVGGVKINF